ncbi:unnamed protein product, partial [Clonostachys byssicola]
VPSLRVTGIEIEAPEETSAPSYVNGPHATQTKWKARIPEVSKHWHFFNSTRTLTSHPFASSLFFVVHLCVEVISPFSTSYTPNVWVEMTNSQDKQDVLRSIKTFLRQYKERRRQGSRCSNLSMKCNKRGHKKAQCPMLKNNTGGQTLSTMPLGMDKPQTGDTKAELVLVTAGPAI